LQSVKKAIQNITDEEWERIYNEVIEFRDFLINKGIEPKKTRRRLRKIIIIFTSNLGANISTAPRKEIGLIKAYEEKKESYEEKVMTAVKNFFKPEFLNRIHKILIFKPLTEEAVRKILLKIIKNLNKRLSSKNVEVILDKSAEEFIIKKGYSQTYGARELERTVDKFITEPISKIILEGKIKEGTKIKISLKEEKLTFTEVDNEGSL